MSSVTSPRSDLQPIKRCGSAAAAPTLDQRIRVWREAEREAIAAEAVVDRLVAAHIDGRGPLPTPEQRGLAARLRAIARLRMREALARMDDAIERRAA